ncbi:TPA: hypothetical protein IBV84_000728 [Escherichia coli]|nr:hypothetical protein [Escherichia coli]HAM4255103.1 hypothetical protein [Escherichia coli]
MHPLTHPLPVTVHVSLLDDDYLTPARASVNGTTLLTRTLKAFMRIARVKMPQS